jgi:hypothetical protein
MKTERAQVVVKFSNIKLHENHFSGSGIVTRKPTGKKEWDDRRSARVRTCQECERMLTKKRKDLCTSHWRSSQWVCCTWLRTLVTSQCLYGEKGLTYYTRRHNLPALSNTKTIAISTLSYTDLQCHPYAGPPQAAASTPHHRQTCAVFKLSFLLLRFHIGAGSRHLNPIKLPRATHLNQVMPSVRYSLIVTDFGMMQCQMAKESP